METFAEELLPPKHPFITSIFFGIGFISGLNSTLLLMGAIVGLCWRNAPRAYGRTMEIMAIVQLITSTLIAGAYVSELVIAFFSQNRYEFYAFTHARLGLTGSDLVALLYWLPFFSILAPQFFWWKRFRRSYLSVLLVALATSFGIWYERLVMLVTSYTAGDYLPSSWHH